VVGAGAIGGYFGGRLVEAGRDVAFLVRPRRAAELARTGLAIRSRMGDADLPDPPLASAEKLAEIFDLVLLACKAYDLDNAMASFAPAVGPDTAILQEMWEKWAFIAASAGITCLMRAAIGDIVAAGASDLAAILFAEYAPIAAKEGFSLRPAFAERTRAMLTAPSSLLTASMLRDIERGAPVEADHILGDLLRRAASNDGSLLRIAYAHVTAYEARQARNRAGIGGAA
jgi:ketopantoate reductase